MYDEDLDILRTLAIEEYFKLFLYLFRMLSMLLSFLTNFLKVE
jgi:hypothetical protein